MFADWMFTTADVEAVRLDRSDFVYADPPYDVEFTQYAKDGFTWDDQQRTAESFARHRGPVVLVNQATTRIQKRYRQQTGGRAEQKVPFEVMCLADAVRAGRAARAYIVLGGDGWTLRDYYVSGGLKEHLIHADLVNVVSLEAFVRIANNGEL